MRLFTYLAIILFLSPSWAETSEYGDMRGLFVSPQFSAMGEGAQAISDEPLPIANPAGIVRSPKSMVYLGYNGYYKNLFSVTSAYLNLAIDSVQNVAVSVSYLIIPDIDSVSMTIVTPGADPEYTFSTITSSEIFIDVRYGRTLFTKEKLDFMVGGALHAKRRRLGDWTGFGIGVDAGVIAQFQGGAALSWQVNNLATEYTHWSSEYSENTLPISYLGIGFIRDITDNFGLKVSYRSPDLFANSGVAGGGTGDESLFDENPREINPWKYPDMFFTQAAYGVEFGIHKVAFFRMGWADTRKITFGGGVHLFERLDVDFVYAHSLLLEGTYGISTRFTF